MKKSELVFRNGLLNQNRLPMIKKIAEAIKENIIKKVAVGGGLTVDQVIQVFEEVHEI